MSIQSRLAKFALLILLVLSLGGPTIFSLDPWDAFPDGGDTAVFILFAAAVLLGATLILAARMLGALRGRAIRTAVTTALPSRMADLPTMFRHHLICPSTSLRI
ncbi:MAG TPA: hypothetical protein VE398_20960 [Acidobacteriota bacterium]|nr:hypothetical protein [Acidobacteriota bacterium]